MFFRQGICEGDQNYRLLGNVVITKAGAVNIHSYIAPEFGTRVGSHIIETENQLVMIDRVGFVCDVMLDAEVQETVVMRFPDAGVFALGDILFDLN